MVESGSVQARCVVLVEGHEERVEDQMVDHDGYIRS